MSAQERWVVRVERRLARWCAQGLGKTWVVAVSGGGDSIGLLRVLHRLQEPLGLRLSVAHLNHGVRGEAALADAAFVAGLAASLNLPIASGDWQPTRRAHFESDARRARYQWLAEVALKHGASVIAVGHTRDDQAETILHRIIRGTGPRGLAGMPCRRALTPDRQLTLVRPLLGVSRHQIRDYLAAIEQPYREDASNADWSRTRARIRHDLLPKLAGEYNPRVAQALVRLGSLAWALERAHEADLRIMEQSAVITQTPECILLEHRFLRSVPLFERAEILRRAWRQAGWPEAPMSASRWRRLAVLVEKDEIVRIDVGARVKASTEKPFLVLRRATAASHPAVTDEILEPIPLAVPGLTAIPWAGGVIEARIDAGPETALDERMDLDQVALPAIVRTAVAGDRFEPLGMGGQSMPLADFFRGRHVGREDRRRVPLVCDQRGIIWVVGHRIADRVKMSVKTGHTLGLLWSRVSA